MGQMFDFEADASKLAASALAFNDILETGSIGAGWMESHWCKSPATMRTMQATT